MNHHQNTHNLFSNIPLWAILIIPITLIIILLATATTYFSYKSSRSSIDNMAQQLLQETNARIELHIESFLATPLHINQQNVSAIENERIDITDIDSVSSYLWDIIQLYESVTSIYFGNAEGGLISGGREGADGSLYIIQTDDFKSGEMNKYATDTEGNITDVLFTLDTFDSRTRGWYMNAVDKGKASWAAPYVLSTGQDLAIASSQPIYDDNNELIAVSSVDIFISHISNFLESLTIGKNGQVYIVEHSGLLVASSTGEPIITDEGERMSAMNSKQPIITASAEHIIQQLGGFASDEIFHQRTIQIEGEPHYLQITPYHTEQGLDWLTVITIPESDFLGEINKQQRQTLILTGISVALAVALTFAITLGVSRPLAHLSRISSNYLAKGEWSQPEFSIEGVKEIRQLGQSFNHMTKQLHNMFTNLEGMVQERTKELEISETRYRAIVETQTELICRYKMENTILTFVNDAYAQYFGKTVDEMIGNSFMEFIPEEDHETTKAYLASFNKGNSIQRSVHRAIDAEGNISWMEWIDYAIYDDDGTLIEVQAVGRDITEKKQFEETLQIALERETELNELQSHFISTVSHEFRTPMSIIFSSSEILKNYHEKLDDEKREHHIDIIQTQISRMTNLLDDVMVVDHSQGNAQLRYEVVDLVHLIQAEIKELQHVFNDDIQFDFSQNGNCKNATVDQRQFQLIILNLLSNAAKYSPKDGTVTVTLDCTNENIIFSVKDNGIGIPKDAQAMIFEPFYRATNVGKISGTGLGLAIVKRSVERHRGTLTLESGTDTGTTITVQLPKSGKRPQISHK